MLLIFVKNFEILIYLGHKLTTLYCGFEASINPFLCTVAYTE